MALAALVLVRPPAADPPRPPVLRLNLTGFGAAAEAPPAPAPRSTETPVPPAPEPAAPPTPPAATPNSAGQPAPAAGAAAESVAERLPPAAAPAHPAGSAEVSTPPRNPPAAAAGALIEWHDAEARAAVRAFTLEYPAVLRANGLEADVVAEMTVAADGSVTAVEIRTSSGFSTVDAAVLQALRRHLFAAANGAATATVRVNFRMRRSFWSGQFE